MLELANKYIIDESAAYIIEDISQLNDLQFKNEEKEYAAKMLNDKNRFLHINSLYKSSFIILTNKNKETYIVEEEIRKAGNKISNITNELKINILNIIGLSDMHHTLLLAEGILLSNYRFTKYLKESENKKVYLDKIKFVNSNLSNSDIEKLEHVVKGVSHSRDIVNEPLSYMTAKRLSEEIEIIGKKYGIKTEILDKKKLESLKMGGILNVNRGSIEPPTFSIMKWEPENSINEKPYILVGKGIVFDTGGINLKPTGYLETMKSDKAGAAAVVGCIAAIAMNKLPIKIIGLIPATENRPGNNAYVPEDIIKMYDGTTVEVTNTDAEGRLILADALAYAKQYNPDLVIDLATLTGAAVVAVGENATAVMGNDSDSITKLKIAGFKVWEKLVELPLWEEYAEQLKSDIADLKNSGGRYAGSITAGKFLEHFTDYKWVHLDIAGPAFTERADSYRGIGGTGVGVRLLFNFFNDLVINYKK